MATAPERKVTVPDGLDPPLAVLTVAVNVTCAPGATVALFELTLVAVGA